MTLGPGDFEKLLAHYDVDGSGQSVNSVLLLSNTFTFCSEIMKDYVHHFVFS